MTREPFAQIDQGFRNYAAVEFVSCNFSNDSSLPTPPYPNVQPLVFFNNAPIHFRSCGFGFPTVGPESGAIDYNIPEQGAALNSTIPIAFHDPSVVTFDSSIELDRSLGNGWDGPFTYLDHTAKGGSGNPVLPRTPLPSTSYLDERVGASGQIRSLGTSLQQFSLGTNLSFTDAGHDKVSFTVDASHQGLVVVGDLVYFDSGTSFYSEGYRPVIGGGPQNLSPYPSTVLAGMVSAVAGNVITLKYRPISLVMPGSYGLVVKYFARYRPAIRGKISNGSNVIDTITDALGNPVDPRGTATQHAYWKKYERIVHPFIPAGTYITGITGLPSPTITLSKNATATTDTTALLGDARGVARVSDGRTDGRTPTYRLVWEVQGAAFATRYYEMPTGWATTNNARWDDALVLWVKDTSAHPASQMLQLPNGQWAVKAYSPANMSFADGAWDGSLSVVLGAGTASVDSAGALTLKAGSGNVTITGVAASNYTVGDANTTGIITVGRSTDTNAIAGSADTADAKTQTVTIAAGSPAGTGKALVTIGNSSGASALTLKAGSGNVTISGAAATAYTVGDANTTGNITIGRSTDTNAIAIGSADTADAKTQTVTIAAGSPAGSGKALVTIGNTNGASAVTIKAGTGDVTITGAAATNYTVGAISTTGKITVGRSTATNTIEVGNADIATGNTQTIKVGAGAAAGSGNVIVDIATGATGSNTVTIGNVYGATGITLKCAGGNITIGTAATAYNVDIATTPPSSGDTQVNIGTGNGSYTIKIGGSNASNWVTIGGASGKVGFFGGTVRSRINSTGGDVTAGGTYGTTEKNMLNDVYKALYYLNGYGLLG